MTLSQQLTCTTSSNSAAKFICKCVCVRLSTGEIPPLKSSLLGRQDGPHTVHCSSMVWYYCSCCRTQCSSWSPDPRLFGKRCRSGFQPAVHTHHTLLGEARTVVLRELGVCVETFQRRDNDGCNCRMMNRPPSSDSPRPSSVGSSQSGRSSKGKSRHDICVGEEIKIAVDIAFEKFRLSEDQKGKRNVADY